MRRTLSLVACACAGRSSALRLPEVGPSPGVSPPRDAREESGSHAASRGPHEERDSLASMLNANARLSERGSLASMLNASARLSDTLGLLAAQLPQEVAKELLTRLRVCASCAELRRFGESHDGGYLACMDGLAGTELRAAYSMGVEYHDKWSQDIYDLLRVPVHQFDCTVEGPAQNCADCHFHKVCLEGSRRGGSHNIGPKMDMQQLLESTGMASAANDSLVMKMDIEGAEWPIFADGVTGLSKFKQLIIEFHSLKEERRHPAYVRALRNIENAGFKVVHIHGNNCCGMYESGGFAIPDIIEVTFVRNGPTLRACEAEQHLHPLDSQNLEGRPDVPMAHLPA